LGQCGLKTIFSFGDGKVIEILLLMAILFYLLFIFFGNLDRNCFEIFRLYFLNIENWIVPMYISEYDPTFFGFVLMEYLMIVAKTEQ